MKIESMRKALESAEKARDGLEPLTEIPVVGYFEPRTIQRILDARNELCQACIHMGRELHWLEERKLYVANAPREVRETR